MFPVPENTQRKATALLAGPSNKGMSLLGSLLDKELRTSLNSSLANPIDATTEIYPKDFTLDVKAKLKYNVFNLGLFCL
jgi:hypothetical protein